MKRYVIECRVFDGMGEDDYYELEAGTLEEAEMIAAEEATEPDEDGCFVEVVIVDREEAQ